MKKTHIALMLTAALSASCVERELSVTRDSFECEVRLENDELESGDAFNLIVESNRTTLKVDEISCPETFSDVALHRYISLYGSNPYNRTFTSEAHNVDADEEGTIVIGLRDTVTQKVARFELPYKAYAPVSEAPTSIIIPDEFKDTYRLDYGKEAKVRISVYPATASNTLIITPQNSDDIYKGQADTTALDRSTLSYTYSLQDDGSYLLTVTGGNKGLRTVTFDVYSRANPLVKKQITFFVRQRLGLYLTGAFGKGYSVSHAFESFECQKFSSRLVTWTGTFTDNTYDHRNERGFSFKAYPYDTEYSMEFRYICEASDNIDAKNAYRSGSTPAPNGEVAVTISKKESSSELMENGVNLNCNWALNRYSSIKYDGWIVGRYKKYAIQLSDIHYDEDKYYVAKVFHAYKVGAYNDYNIVDKKNRRYWWQFLDTPYWVYDINLDERANGMVSVLK